MSGAKKVNRVIADLQTNPTKEHWEVFSRYLLKTKAKYYKVFYPKKLKSKADLLSAYVMIYDQRYMPMFRLPVFMKAGKDIRGATIYFKELLNTNKDYKEWIS